MFGMGTGVAPLLSAAGNLFFTTRTARMRRKSRNHFFSAQIAEKLNKSKSLFLRPNRGETQQITITFSPPRARRNSTDHNHFFSAQSAEKLNRLFFSPPGSLRPPLNALLKQAAEFLQLRYVEAEACGVDLSSPSARGETQNDAFCDRLTQFPPPRTRKPTCPPSCDMVYSYW